MLVIALGRSEYTNGMIFYNPIMDSFCTLADFLIDKNRHVSEVFLSLRYDGGLTMSVLSGKDDMPAKFNIGDRVFMQDYQTYDVLERIVTMQPTTQNKYYTIRLVDDSPVHDMAPSDLYGADDVASTGKPSASINFFQPDWVEPGQKVVLLNGNVYKQGYLNINKDSLCEFVSRDPDRRIAFTHSLSNKQYGWKI